MLLSILLWGGGYLLVAGVVSGLLRASFEEESPTKQLQSDDVGAIIGLSVIWPLTFLFFICWGINELSTKLFKWFFKKDDEKALKRTKKKKEKAEKIRIQLETETKKLQEEEQIIKDLEAELQQERVR